MTRAVAAFYRENPRMISSPFGGIDGVDAQLYRVVLDSLAIDFNGRRVLDVGCGRGFLGEVVLAGGGEYVGVDLVASGRGFPLATADAARLPFPDGAFDAVCCVDAFEHFPDPASAAREFRRVLQPRGFMFLSAPNYSNVAGLAKLWCERFGSYRRNTWAPFGRWQPQEHETFITAAKIRRWFVGAGFNRISRVGLGREVGLGVFPWIDHPQVPESIRFRAQTMARLCGPAVARIFPGASLHNFWRFDCPGVAARDRPTSG